MIQMTSEQGTETVAVQLMLALLGWTPENVRSLYSVVRRHLDGIETYADTWFFVLPSLKESILTLPEGQWVELGDGLRFGWRRGQEAYQAGGEWVGASHTIYMERDPEAGPRCTCVGCRDGAAPWGARRIPVAAEVTAEE